MKKYEKYKDSGVEFIGKLPISWDCYNLKFILREGIKDGPHETPIWFEEGIPFLSIDGIVDGEISFNNCRYIDEVQFQKFSKKLVIEKDDIFIGKAASIGKIARVKTDKRFTVWSPIAVVKVKKEFNPTFVEYYFRSDIIQHQIEIFSTSNTQKNIAMGDIPKMKFIAPPFAEQTAIANYLDHKTAQIDNLISKKEKLIELLKEERTATINQAVTKGLDPNVPMKDSGIEWLGEIPEEWEVTRLANFGYFLKGRGVSKADLTETGIPVILYGDIYTKYNYFTENIKRATSIELAENSIELFNRDLLFTGSGETKEDIGKCICYIGNNRAVAGGDVIIFRQNEHNSKFLSYVFNSFCLNIEKAKLSKGEIVVHVYASQLRNIHFPLPAKDEQNYIVSYIEKELNRIGNIISNTQHQISLLKEYKTALISEVVTGKVDVRGEEISNTQ